MSLTIKIIVRIGQYRTIQIENISNRIHLSATDVALIHLEHVSIVGQL